MKRKLTAVFLIFNLLLALPKNSEASLPVFDAVNAALSELRNSLMQTQFAREILVLVDQFEQAKSTYLELLRFNSGLDEFFSVFMGDPLKEFVQFGKNKLRGAFVDFGWITPKIEILNGSTEPGEIKGALEEITGEIPDSTFRPYIPFEEMQVVEGFQFAQEIREAGRETRSAAEELSLQAKSASPKGAQRLGVEAMSRMIVLGQENQEALAKLIELAATQVEQVSREEKRLERERQRYMDEVGKAVETLWSFR